MSETLSPDWALRSRRWTDALAAPGSHHCLTAVIRTWLANHQVTGDSLDVGCGPTSRLWAAGLRAVGIDIDPSTVEAYRNGGGEGIVAEATSLPFGDSSFGSVWSFGLLHHLADGDGCHAVTEMVRATTPGGWTLVFDAVLPNSAWRQPVAALIRHLDRGRFMRRQASLEKLLARAAPGVWECRRITYAWTGLEGLFCARCKD